MFFLIHLTTRSSTLNPSPLLRKNWRLNYWVSMKTTHKSFHLRLFALFSLNWCETDLAHSSRRPNLSKAPLVSVRAPRHFFFSSFPIFFVIIVWQINKNKINWRSIFKMLFHSSRIILRLTTIDDSKKKKNMAEIGKIFSLNWQFILEKIHK